MPTSPIQQTIIDARGGNILVSASAGSGKTSVLVERLCQLVIQDKISLDKILAVTFTEDAALEMKTRLKKRLQELDASDPYVASQLALLETASISTIHGFCLDLVSRFYYYLHISYTMSQTVDTGLLDEQALQNAYTQALLELDPQAAAGLSLYMDAFGKNEEDTQAYILKFLEIAKTKPDPDAWMASCRQENPDTQAWFERYFELRLSALKMIFEQMCEHIQEMEFPKAGQQEEWLVKFTRKIEALEQAQTWLEAHEYEKFAHCFIAYLETTDKFTPTINKQKFHSEQKSSRAYEGEIMDCLFSMKQFGSTQQSIQKIQQTFVDLALSVRAHFQANKKEMEFIDFSDMEQFACQLLQIPAVAQQVQEQYEVILVDEYQDTNDLQETILSLASRGGNLFRVGDIKQSIYGFRQARPALMKDLMACTDGSSQLLVMDENFRSTSNIIAFNNEFFSRLMNIPGMESQFSQTDVAHAGTQEQCSSEQKPIRFLFTQYSGWKDPEKAKTTDLQARSAHLRYRYDMIARDILKQVKEGVEFRDIVILTRATTVHPFLKEALEAYGIPVLSRAKKGFYTNQAVQIVMAALQAIASPYNDIALMAMLCSPLAKASQASIIKAVLENPGHPTLYEAIRFEPFMKAYEYLSRFKHLPIGELVEKIYNYNDFYYRSTTAQDKTNLDLFLQKAARAQDLMDLDSFLEQVMQEESFDNTSEALPFGREANVVKLSTIHASKGLQYDVVYVLADDMNRDMDAGSPVYFDADLGLSLMGLLDEGRIKQKTHSHIALETKRFLEDQNEKMRLLYVASTRAKKELIFVSTIKSLDEYASAMDMNAILANKGFASWLVHIFSNWPTRLVVMEEITDLEKRPEQKKEKNRWITNSRYTKEARPVYSVTASAAKLKPEWKEISLGAQKGMERGTLFHEMAEKLPYPYQPDEVLAYASLHGFTLGQTDLEQFLSLNQCQLYRQWMSEKHTFEMPYTISVDDAITHGYMDLVAEHGQTIDILDFKTDNVFDMNTLISRYKAQLKTYRDAMKAISPDKTVRTYIYSFFLKEVAEVRL